MRAARYRSPNGGRRVIGFTDRGRQVVSMSGDGGFSMLMGDSLTLVQYDLPVKVVLFDNSSPGMAELEMPVSGLSSYGTTDRTPDFAAIARAAGAFEGPGKRPGSSRGLWRTPSGTGDPPRRTW